MMANSVHETYLPTWEWYHLLSAFLSSAEIAPGCWLICAWPCVGTVFAVGIPSVQWCSILLNTSPEIWAGLGDRMAQRYLWQCGWNHLLLGRRDI